MDRGIPNMILQINAGNPFQSVSSVPTARLFKREIEISSS